MNKKVVFLSLCVATYLQSADLNKVVVEEKINTITVKNIGQEELKSADLAEAIVKNVPSASLVRRSGIANDIILRGQKRDNINIIVDGTKTCGACVNRMDPPTSHIANQIVENVEIKEGPFDVENMGTLSGLVNITTREPKDGFSGEVNFNMGSFGYQKESLTINGGNKDIKALVTVAHEKSEQYEDGNGDDFAEQLKKVTDGTSSVGTQYQPRYENMDAYEKTTFMAKILGHINDDQDIKISYTGNRSDDVLYPSSKMDAIWDDSDIINFEYEIRNIAKYSKTLNFQMYNSQVDHPMSIRYRKKAVAINPMNDKPYGDMTNHLTTEMQGIKLKNSFDLSNTAVTVGLDTSTRNWDGTYYQAVNGAYMRFPMGASKGEIKKSIDDGESVNRAIFVKTNTNMGNIALESGLRFDDTEVTNGGTAPDNDYSSLSGNIFATIEAGNDMRYFIGLGKSTRVPDTRELYFMSSMSPDQSTLMGNPNLDQTTNYEVDLGFEKVYDNFSIKTKMFYSMLKDYIYLNASKKKNVFENIDAKIYGVEVSGAYLATESLYLDYGVAYKKGEKDDPLAGQTDTDLAEISPLKANIGIGYDYDSSLRVKLDIVAASAWDDYDSDNGEQKLDGYTVLNMKINKEFNNGFGFTIGVDNILDEAYTTTNTYKDLTLITTGVGVDDVMLLNEPGRYFYVNASYKF